MEIKNYIWNQTRKFGCQLDSLYYYQRVMRMLESEIFIAGAMSKKKDMAIDIGANNGIWSYHLSKSFLNVEAFEPIDECCDIIRSTRRRNIRVHNEALSSSPGSMELHIPVESGLLLKQSATFGEVDGQCRRVVVPVNTLDSYSFTGVGFIKIDVEGHEIEVLKGAQRTISREKPVMIIEIEQRHLSFPMDNVFELLRSYGYNAFFRSGRKLRPYADFSYEMDQLPYFNELESPMYVRNFIFIPGINRH
ncbi:MAG: FkbM family methyltransferase [Dehalococcoidia bacterium]|jgi:FkbM family methyltransferase